MTTVNTKRSTEHPIDRPPDTDPQQGHEHPEADPPTRLRGGGPDGKRVASDAPEGGGALQTDDGDIARTGGTWQTQGADSGELGPPAQMFSDTNQPSTGPVSSGPGRPRQA